MKVLFLSTSDIQGGAFRGAYRLYKGLQSIGVETRMLVQHKKSDDHTVVGPSTKITKAIAKLFPTLDRLPLYGYPNRHPATWSIGWILRNLEKTIDLLHPDIVHLHWVGGGFLPIKALAKIKQPIIWTLRDMWAFTGGCHYDKACGRYQDSCGACPQLGSHTQLDLSRMTYKHKQRSWQGKNITIVAISHWLASCARASSLFRHHRIEVIPNGLDLTQYKPLPRHVARDMLALPQDKQLVLFGALSSTSDRRKGFHLLKPALQQLASQGWGNHTEAVVFGASRPEHVPDLGMAVHYTGYLHDDVSLALLYSAADVFVIPSIQEALGNVVLEALACGTPCVGFAIGGIPDMIEHEQNGYLAQPYVVEDLAQGMAWVLGDAERWQRLSRRARAKVEQEFALERVAAAYRRLYGEVIED